MRIWTALAAAFDSATAGRRLRARDVVACLVALVVLTAAAFVPYALHGGFFSDDWAVASDVHVSPGTGYAGAVHQISKESGGRPLLAAALPLPHVLFGESPRAHVLFGLFLGILTCLCFFAVLRLLGLAPGHAIVIACLALLFPWADSVRLWPTVSITGIAVTFFFLGVCLALVALEADGWRRWLLGGLGTAFYLASVLTYEVAGVAACLVGVLYLRRAPRSHALWRWAVDVFVVVAALAWSAHATRGVRHVASPSQVLSDVPSFVRQGSSLLAVALLAFPGTDGAVAKAVMLLAIAAVLALAARSVVRTRDAAAATLVGRDRAVRDLARRGRRSAPREQSSSVRPRHRQSRQPVRRLRVRRARLRIDRACLFAVCPPRRHGRPGRDARRLRCHGVRRARAT